MENFHSRLERALKEKGQSFYKLQFPSAISSGTFSSWKDQSRRPSDADLEKLASVSWLGISLDTLRLWRAIDEYPELITHEGLLDLLESLPEPEKALAVLKEALDQRTKEGLEA